MRYFVLGTSIFEKYLQRLIDIPEEEWTDDGSFSNLEGEILNGVYSSSSKTNFKSLWHRFY